MTELERKAFKKMKWNLFLLGRFKIPLIGFVKPKLLVLNDDRSELSIRLRRRTKNHLDSMYFGALAVGADVTAGLFAFYHAEKLGRKVSFAFKGMTAEFHKRAESDVRFVCDEGMVVQKCLQQSIYNEERVNHPIKVAAFDKDNEEVASFEMIISVRIK